MAVVYDTEGTAVVGASPREPERRTGSPDRRVCVPPLAELAGPDMGLEDVRALVAALERSHAREMATRDRELDAHRDATAAKIDALAAQVTALAAQVTATRLRIAGWGGVAGAVVAAVSLAAPAVLRWLVAP